MYKVRTNKDRKQLIRLIEKATQRALTPTCKNWRKHSLIAETLQRELEHMLIFENYTIGANGTLRRWKHGVYSKF